MSSCRPKHQKRTTENAARGQSSSSTLAVPSRKPYDRPRPRSAPNPQGGPAIDIDPGSSRPVHQTRAHGTARGYTGSTLVSRPTSTDSTFLDVPRDKRHDRPRSTPTTSGPYHVPYSSTRAFPEARTGPSSGSLPSSGFPSHYAGHQLASRVVTPLPTPHVRAGMYGSPDPSGWPEPLPHGPDIFTPIPGHSTSPLHFYQLSDLSLPGPSQYHVQSSSSAPAPPPLVISDGEPYYDPRNSHRSAPFPQHPSHLLHYMSTSNGDPSIPHQYRHAQHLQQAPSDYLYHNQPSVAYHPRSVTRADHTSRPFPQQTPSFFPHSHNFHLENFSYHEAPQRGASTLDWERGWDDLVKLTRPNALYDSDARFDPPRCDEDTRLEVTKEVMNWITDREAPTRLLCMTGAAGAGKSALQQTIAERCLSMGILASAFFFWKTDGTRNSLTGVIPTIAYQLGLKHPALRKLIGNAVAHDPMIFRRSVAARMKALVAEPVKAFMASHADEDARNFPYALLIDGLDECEEECQAELLDVIKAEFLDNHNTPFRIYISSRPEWAIRTALKSSLAGLAYLIPLSDKYDASEDIRRFLRRRLREIGLRSGDPRAQLHGTWPTEEDIEFLVKAASGQFIYAAIVVKYISERPSSPVDRLRVVLTWKPAPGQRAAPFAMLDLLYTNILSTANAAFESIDTNDPDDFLVLLLAYQGGRGSLLAENLDAVDRLLNYPEKMHEVVLSDLRSVVYVTDKKLQHYHKSFEDFFDSKLRAKKLYISSRRMYAFLLTRILDNIEIQGVNGKYLARLIESLASILKSIPLNIQSVEEMASLLLDFTRHGVWATLYHQLLNLGAERSGSGLSLEEGRALLSLGETLGSLVFGTNSWFQPVDPLPVSPGKHELVVALQQWLFSNLSIVHSLHEKHPAWGDHDRILKRSLEANSPRISPYDTTWWNYYLQDLNAMALSLLETKI
ncbi:hypothetical protein DFP72DRAFT_436419 [Ephemerocybe angulata]|uniref:Nephrocystin 3-like N-terminal domain-containing protein n=1 Tax=Ephemerocybe angulata TaxID=980116 RepID=A0A8H6HTV0_9AGAR|nr:hypothetical protein DFP72DRAFT_436419 [Tulosesus angulatus]